ncbi:MAG: hypothetical protein J5800_03000 [Spirochaetales bacterium]|nr:hypothetical protein [Spirochaetales bacterium]
MDYNKEKQEAIEAGERALRSLREARNHISSAKGFGLWDIFGGGSLVSLAKHYKVGRAKDAIQQAKYDLQAFSRELRDVEMNLDINIGDFLTIFDLMDNFFADIMVQSRLSDAARRIDEAIRNVEDCLQRLRWS